MNAVFILLPLALLIAGIMLALFIWAVRSGQFDDLETPAVRILFDDEPKNTGEPPEAPGKRE
jgi:cbb3-type cytochrome oxidase maturation protein